MSAVTERLSLEQFRKTYGEDVKPYYEYWDGEAIQKAMPTKLHALLQKILTTVLEELGLYSYPELTLRIDPNWEPVPDVAATLKNFDGPYPTAAVDVVVEVLSPPDAFILLEEKCERYAAMGVTDILVFDPVDRKAWSWDRTMKSLIRVSEANLPLRSNGSKIDLADLWRRFDSRLN